MMTRVEYAPDERVYEHPELLAEVVRACCELEPEDYAVSDESVLSELADIDVDADIAPLYAIVQQRYGIAVIFEPEPYLWQVIDQIARQQR